MIHSDSEIKRETAQRIFCDRRFGSDRIMYLEQPNLNDSVAQWHKSAFYKSHRGFVMRWKQQKDIIDFVSLFLGGVMKAVLVSIRRLGLEYSLLLLDLMSLPLSLISLRIKKNRKKQKVQESAQILVYYHIYHKDD